MMLTDAFKIECRDLGELLEPLCEVFTEPNNAFQALAANQPVALLTDPDVKPNSYNELELTFELYCAHPSTDSDTARDFFARALNLLTPIGYDSAVPYVLTPPSGHVYYGYKIAYTETYTD